MITAIANLSVKARKAQAFENTFKQAQHILVNAKGYISHRLQKSVDTENKYALIIQWQTLEDHLTGFRKSEAYKEWKALLHHFYDPLPKVEHYQEI